MENLLQASIITLNRLETQISYLINIVNAKNEKTLPTQFLTIPDTSSHIDETQESRYLGDFNQYSISPDYIELDRHQTFDMLVSFYFNKIELEQECYPNP